MSPKTRPFSKGDFIFQPIFLRGYVSGLHGISNCVNMCSIVDTLHEIYPRWSKIWISKQILRLYSKYPRERLLQIHLLSVDKPQHPIIGSLPFHQFFGGASESKMFYQGSHLFCDGKSYESRSIQIQNTGISMWKVRMLIYFWLVYSSHQLVIRI